MEAFDQSRPQSPITFDFSQFIRSVQLNCQRSELSRRNKVVLRRHMRDQWLYRSKILPPTFQRLSPTTLSPSSSHGQVIQLSSFEDYRRTTPLIEGQNDPALQVQMSRTHTSMQMRGQSKTSHEIPRNLPSCQKKNKSNWKLQFRRDQLNVLRYTKQEEEENIMCHREAQKSFKVRRVQKKFQQLKPQAPMYQLYRSNIDRIKQNRTPSPSLRYRTATGNRS